MDSKSEIDSDTVKVAMERHDTDIRHRRRNHSVDVIIKRYLFVTVLTCAILNCSSLVVSCVAGNSWYIIVNGALTLVSRFNSPTVQRLYFSLDYSYHFIKCGLFCVFVLAYKRPFKRLAPISYLTYMYSHIRCVLYTNITLWRMPNEYRNWNGVAW